MIYITTLGSDLEIRFRSKNSSDPYLEDNLKEDLRLSGIIDLIRINYYRGRWWYFHRFDCIEDKVMFLLKYGDKYDYV